MIAPEGVGGTSNYDQVCSLTWFHCQALRQETFKSCIRVIRWGS